MKIKVIVKPNSLKNEISNIKENEYRVNIKSLPEKGKANKELIKFLKKYFNKSVRIITGLKSREKVIELY